MFRPWTPIRHLGEHKETSMTLKLTLKYNDTGLSVGQKDHRTSCCWMERGSTSFSMTRVHLPGHWTVVPRGGIV
jgi:hypothetical protein